MKSIKQYKNINRIIMKDIKEYINENNDITIKVSSNADHKVLDTYVSNFNEFKNGNKYVIKFIPNGEYIEKGYDSCSTTSNIKKAKILSNPKKMEEVLYQFWIHLFNSFRLKDINPDDPMFELEEV